MTVEREHIFEKLFALETWERLSWLNQKWNKSKEEKADIVKSAGVFPLIIMSMITADWIFGILICSITNNQLVRIITEVGCVWLFVAINLTHYLTYVLRITVIVVSLVFILTIPTLLMLVI